MPTSASADSERVVERGGVRLAVTDAGEGVPVVLLHGLTATRRYVVMGSRALERSDHRVVAYDARGHGGSSPAPHPDAYTYDELVFDLVGVMDELAIERAVLAGASMGAHTALRLALQAPERVAGLVVITPGYDPETQDDERRLGRWDALADGLERGGVEGFLAAYGRPEVTERWQEPVTMAIRQRMALHEHPGAVAQALRVVPRARPFARLEELASLQAPVTVVASSDQADPGHPEPLARAYARAIPAARLVTDSPGKSPIAWQGSQLSRLIAEVAAEADW